MRGALSRYLSLKARSRHALPHAPPEPACDRAGDGARLPRPLHLEHAKGAVARGNDDIVSDRQNRARFAACIVYANIHANVGELDRLAAALHEDARPGIEGAETVVDRLRGFLEANLALGFFDLRRERGAFMILRRLHRSPPFN